MNLDREDILQKLRETLAPILPSESQRQERRDLLDRLRATFKPTLPDRNKDV